MSDSVTKANSGRKLLLLDLDETLVYAAREPLTGRAPDFYVGPYSVYKRPHLSAFLDACFAWFDVAVWTASSPVYAAEVVAAVFPDPQALMFVWASDRCTMVYEPETGAYYTCKNLVKLRRKRRHPLGAIIAVDDTPQKWERSYGNLVRVCPFEGDPSDEELPRLAAYLNELRRVPNVRAVEKRNWRHCPVYK